MADLRLGGQDDGIAMKGAQSKAKWGGHDVNGGIGPRPPPPRNYATAEREREGGREVGERRKSHIEIVTDT